MMRLSWCFPKEANEDEDEGDEGDKPDQSDVVRALVWLSEWRLLTLLCGRLICICRLMQVPNFN